jgi:hypothetical protein
MAAPDVLSDSFFELGERTTGRGPVRKQNLVYLFRGVLPSSPHDDLLTLFVPLQDRTGRDA